jgi:hypothetical protein
MNRNHYKLTDEQKVWLVQRVAAFDSTRAIIKSLQQAAWLAGRLRARSASTSR